jgi:hypothetical protein
MSRRKRRPKSRPAGEPSPTSATRERTPIVPWRQRARELLHQLRDWVRAEHGPAVEDYLHLRFGPAVTTTPVADLERAFDDFVFSRGSGGEGRSLVAVFADEADALASEERAEIRSWEEKRARGVYLLDRAQRDLLVLWNPVDGSRTTLHLLERMARGYVAGLQRGAVVVVTTMPYADRLIALGEVETWNDDEAIQVFRKEVRESGKPWNELPKPTP